MPVLGGYVAHMDMNEAVASAINAERAIAKLTVRSLAEASGIPERSLMRVLQAERDIKISQVAQIASALGIYPHELIEHAEQILARHDRGPAKVMHLPERPRSSEIVEDTVEHDKEVTPTSTQP